MRNFLLSLLIIGTSLFAETLLEFQKGWQLVGTPQTIDDLSVFDDHAEIIWAYDAGSGAWQGYAPDPDIAAKLSNAGIVPLTHLDTFAAFWINSNASWTLMLPDAKTPDAQDVAPKLHLEKGWNLVSLPDSAVVDADLFEGMKLWKYDEAAWQTNQSASLPFPGTATVKSGEGFWLYSDTNRTIDIPEAASALHTFENEAQMQAYIREMALYNRDGYYLYGPYVPESDFSGTDVALDGGKADDATTTNIQEEGIDESDILKHNGDDIFFYDRQARRIRIYTFASIVAGETKERNGIDLDGELQAMYLDGDRLAVLSQERLYYILDDTVKAAAIMPPGYMPQRFVLTLYDVSDTADITKVSETAIDGYYSESRLKAHTLYLISHFTPQITYDYPVIYPDTNCSDIVNANSGSGTSGSTTVCESGDAACESKPVAPDPYYEQQCYLYNYDENGTPWQYDYEHPIIKSEYLVPILSQNGTEQPYVEPQRLWAPYKLDQEYGITSIGAFDMQTGNLKQQTAYIGDNWTQYASADALYLAATTYPRYYDGMHYREQTALYKFALDDNLSYRARGFVDGRVLGQYSLSEYNDTLRAAATQGFSWRSNADNSVFTLRETADRRLETVGSVNGLGHEGETIRAVRFAGDKGFVVTFRQTDPFYTLDLSDPLHPQVLGELEINGFSEYLHPVDENRILSIGRDADANGVPQGLQVQLFDISDLSRPTLADKITIGDRHTYSEAEHNPRAFAYRRSDALFGFPLYSYVNRTSEVGFDLYQVNGFSLEHHQLISTQAQEGWYGYEGRGIIFDYDGTTYGSLFKGSHVIVEPLKGEQP